MNQPLRELLIIKNTSAGSFVKTKLIMMKTLLKKLTILIAIFGFSNAWAQPTFSENGLVSYYPFNSNSKDYTGYANFDFQGAYVFDRFDSTTSALSSPGYDMGLPIQSSIPSETVFSDLKVGNGNTDFTVSAWVKLTGPYTSGHFPTALSIGGGIVLRFNAISATQLRATAVIKTNPGSFYVLNSTNSNFNFTPNNQWVHLAFVKNGNQYFLYANEVGTTNQFNFNNLQGTTNNAFTYGPNQNTDLGLYVGFDATQPNLSPTLIRGDVDDVFLYNRALNFQEVWDLYNVSNHNVVGTTPSITASSNAVCAGENITLSIPTNNDATAYQWQKDGVNISNNANYSGATTNELTISNTTTALSGEYRCLASVPGATIFSERVSIQIFDNPSSNINDFLVNYFPLNNNYDDVVGSKTLTQSGIEFADDQFNASNASAITDASDGKITIDQPFDLETGSISMWFYRPATIQAQNKVILASENEPLFFTGVNDQFVYVNGIGFIQPDGGNVFIEEGWHHIVITKSNNLMDVFIDNVKVVDNDPNAYSLIQEPIKFIGGNNNPANSNVGQRFDEIRFYDTRLNEEQVALLYNAPIISKYTEDEVSACEGETLNLSVEAGGATSFQWRKNGIPISDGNGISGSTTNNLTISNFAAADAGTYKVIISNNCFDNESFNTQITALPSSTTISQQPQDASACEGAGVSFSVATTGDAPLSYQWFFGNTVLTNDATYSGTNTSTLTIAGASATVEGDYKVAVETSCGNIESNTATLSLTGGQINALVETQNGAELSVNDDYDTYAWFNVEEPANTLSTENSFTATENGSYQVTVTASGCESTSGVFLVDVFEEDPNSIAQVSKENVKIYPNPTQNILNIEFDNITTVEIFSITGVKLAELNGASKYQYNTSSLASGLYFVKAGKQTLKFVKN